MYFIFITWFIVHKKGNISILVIFVLLASSLLGVLAMNFVQSMMKQSATIYNHYQSYYLAKAGIELVLAEIGHRGVWFEQSLSDGTSLSGNFLCKGRCDLSFDLVWRSKLLSQQFGSTSGCQFPIVLSEGMSFVLPLFADTFVWSIAQSFVSPISYTNLYGSFKASSLQTTDTAELIFGMVILSGESLASNGIFFQKGSLSQWFASFISAFDTLFTPTLSLPNLSNSNIAPYRFFFVLSNPSPSKVSFCLLAPEPLPMQQYLIQSQWVYDHQTLGLEASYQQPIPDFLFGAYSLFADE